MFFDKLKKSIFNWNFIVFILILLLASGIRFYNPIFRSLWGDEVDSLFRIYNFSLHNFHYEPISIFDRLQLALFNPLKGHHLPAYYLLLGVWTALFGFGEIAVRSLSVILGILCVPITYWLARELYDDQTARLSAFLMAISSFAVFYSQEIRPYALMLFMSTASSLFFWRIFFGKAGLANWIGYFVSSFILILSHIFGGLAISAQSLYLLFVWFQKQRRQKIIQLAGAQVLLYILVLLILLPIFISGIKTMSGMGQDFPFTQIPGILKLCLNFFVLGFGESLAPWNWLIVIPAGLVYLYLFGRMLVKWRDPKILFLLTLLLWPNVFSVFLIKLTLPKYLIIVLPVFLVLIGRAIIEIRSIYVKAIILLVLIFTQLFSINNYYQIKEYHNANQMEPWRQVSGNITDQFKPGDVILVNSYDVSFRLLQYYLNVLKKGQYPIFLVNYPGSPEFISEDGGMPIFISSLKLANSKYDRIFLIIHLRDDRKTPLGAIASLKQSLLKTYKLKLQNKYIPYEETLISKLPFFKPKNGENRIVIEIYDRIKVKD